MASKYVYTFGAGRAEGDAKMKALLGGKGAGLAEMNKLGIPVVAVVDTNHSPEGLDYVIPGNDDSSRAIRLYARGIADAVLEGRNLALQELVAAGADEFVEVDEGAQDQA